MNTPSTQKTFLYNFAHLALPILALCNPKKFYDEVTNRNGEKYLISMYRALANKQRVSELPTGLSIAKKIQKNNNEIIIIQLPKPQTQLEVFFIAIVFRVEKNLLSKEIKSVRYLLLELGKNILSNTSEYHLCEWVGCLPQTRDHLNHGRLSNANREVFIEAVLSRL